MANKEKSFYQRLTRLFRSGPAIRRKIKGQDYKNYYDSQVVQNNLGYYGAAGFKREASPFSVMGAYGILDRMSRYCLTGETEVATNSKKGTVRMDELAKMFSGEKPQEPIHTFAYDHKTNSIVLAEIENAFFTKEAEITEVELDNGKIVRCTADHRFMLRDGSYVQAQNLVNGDALMPFYRKNLEKYKNGNMYRVIYSPSDGWCGEHKIVGNYLFGRKILTEDNKHVHHKNFCGIDNDVNNLEIMDKNEHMLMHARDGQRSSDRKSAYWDKKLQGNPSINSLKFTGRKKKDRIKQTVRYEKCTQPNYKNPNADADFTIDNIIANWTSGITSQALAKKCGVHYGKFFARLKWAGYGNYAEFVRDKCDSHYKLNHKNPRKISDLPAIQQIYSLFKEGKTQRKIAQELNENVSIILSTIRKNGFPTWQSFITEYKNHKVVSVKHTGIVEKVYDITVKDYHNFAINQGVIVHNSEFAEMENCAEIASALNVYADESCATDEVGQTFHIYSDNSQIQSTLEELFYEVLNIEFNARRMIRNLVKNGDYFMYVEVVPDHGVINIEPLPVNEVEREEGFDKHDPYAVRFRLITRGGKYLENWQMLHFRVLGNDLFLPYGTSLLESARRPWRQLTMMEDSMLVYRLVRSPERRVFYVDVSAIHPNDVPSYMEGVKESMRGTSVIDQQQGRQDFRYNPLAVDEDYFLPTRPNNQTKIESIAGGANTTATEDVDYILKKLIAALMVPKAYLTYDEAISSKATLAQEDIRFSRTVATLQKIVVAELNKLATIHLYALGFAGEDLTNFELRFSNPSTVAVQQKLALISSKIEIAGKAWELSKETGMYSMNYIQRELLSLRPEEINIIRQEARQDQVFMAELKKIAENPPFDNSVDSNIDIFDKENYKVPTSPFAPDKKDVRDIEQQNHEDERDYQARRAKEREENGQSPKNTPISFNPTPNLDKAFRRKSRSKALTGNRALSLPDFKSMLDPNNRYAKDVYGTQDLNKARKFMLEDTNLQKELLGEVAHLVPMRGLTKETQSSLHKMNESLFKKDIELRDVEIISEDTMDDELFVIERELK